MTTFSFTFVVSGVDPEADDFEHRFFEAGCDDATIALMRGAVTLSFDRDAASYLDAVISAYDDILKSGASLVRFEPDFLVNTAEIAERAHLSRQAVSLFEKGERGAGGFPAPVARVTSHTPLWDWVSVATWLHRAKKVDEQVVLEAVVARQVNRALQSNAAALDLKAQVSRVAGNPFLSAA